MSNDAFDKKKAAQTAITHWEAEQETYITQSPLYDFFLGAGETEEESMEDFLAHLDIHHRAWENGTHGILNHRRKLGRPFSGRVSVNTRMKPDIKVALEQLAKLHKKSKGEIIEILVEKAQRNDVAI